MNHNLHSIYYILIYPYLMNNSVIASLAHVCTVMTLNILLELLYILYIKFFTQSVMVKL